MNFAAIDYFMKFTKLDTVKLVFANESASPKSSSIVYNFMKFNNNLDPNKPVSADALQLKSNFQEENFL